MVHVNERTSCCISSKVALTAFFNTDNQCFFWGDFVRVLQVELKIVTRGAHFS